MSTLYKCDRCHKIGTVGLQKVDIPAPDNRSDYKQNRMIDLCNVCLIELNKFADPLLEIIMN